MVFGTNILDIVVVVTLLFFTIHSFFKGTIHEIFSLLALVLGLFLAQRFYHQTAQAFEKIGGNSKAGIFVAFILLFFVVYLIVILLGKLLKKIIKTAQLSWMDHLGGAFIGMIKGILLLCMLVAVLVMVLPSESQLIRTSRLAPLLYQTSSVLLQAVPPAIKKKFREKIEELETLRKRRPAPHKAPQRHTPGKRGTPSIEFSFDTLSFLTPVSSVTSVISLTKKPLLLRASNP
ncbi:MAG: CvpA family protein [bacterium]